MKLPKFLRLPTVVELGKSEYNALPMEDLGAKPGDYTWESYEKEMKETYPIKHFFFYPVARWFRRKWYVFDRFIYKIKCHTLKKYRFHLLDLRQPKTNEPGCDHYRQGFIDSDNQILLAMFNILVNFCEKEHEDILEYINSIKEESEKNIDGCNWGEQIKAYEEIYAIYKYWKFDRKIERKALDELLTECYCRKKNINDPTLEFKKTEYTRLEKEFEDKETKMLHRLIDVRKYMWT